MTTDAQPASPIGTDNQLLFDRVARCCEPAAWARSRGWLAQAGRLAVDLTAGDVSPGDWAGWLQDARPSLQARAQGLVRAMAHQVWRLETFYQAPKGSSARLHAAISVGGQRWRVGLAAVPRLQIVTLATEGHA
ncbi:MAG TPA: hypothetical protein H9903_06860 [Candidatus Aquabacterium excrementipullorum]|nr:hypothetical protein [Candidatus Aquabacterium excrementipullorum]